MLNERLPSPPVAGLTVADAYRRMSMIRRFEEKILELTREGEVAGSVHLCLGQEAIPVGAMAALKPEDRVLATYRGHGWALSVGSNPVDLMAEIAQRAGGLNGGRAGSPLLSDPDRGFLGENSIVGAGSPIGAGVGLAFAARGSQSVVITSFGDGAMNQGATTEGMIFAAARNLPVIFLCENNDWSEMTPTSEMVRNANLSERASGLGIDSWIVDGGDPFAVAEAVAAAASKCRDGRGPIFLEAKTVRLSGHYNRDVEHYRPAGDKQAAIAGDPLARLRALGGMNGGIDDTEADAIDVELDRELEEIVSRALSMPKPDAKSVGDHLVAPELTIVPAGWGPCSQVEAAYWKAVNLALRAELEGRPEVLVYGEDVGFAGGIFGVTRNLQADFGPERVFDTPISESAILGSAVGASISGMRPVVEIMWADFVFVALDQIINQASNVRYVNRGKLTAPLTVRMQQGVTPGSCAQHAQSVEAILAHIPGIKVGLPSNPQDAYRMTRAAVADPDPTILIEGRALYQDTQTIEIGGDPETASGARRLRSGSDLVIITWGVMVGKSLIAADELAEEGISISVLDLRWLRPLDDDAIRASVAGSGSRVIVVHEDFVSGGFGAEVAARVNEMFFAQLAAPVVRIGAMEVRIPSAPSLQDAVVPGIEKIKEAARAVIKR